MHKLSFLQRNFLIFGIPALLLTGLVIILQVIPIQDARSLSWAFTLDLLLTVPLVYFLLIRKTSIPITTVVPVIGVGMVIGSYFLPADSQTYLDHYKTWALPLIELSVMGFIIWKIRAGIHHYKTLDQDVPDFFEAAKKISAEIMPKRVAILVATEIAVIYYAFIHWKRIPLKENEFSYHQKSGTPALLGAFLFLILVETFILHILVGRASEIAAWILTGLSLYTIIQLFGILKALPRRPIRLTKESLHLQYGILGEVRIPFTSILRIELADPIPDPVNPPKKLSPMGDLERHNIMLEVNDEQVIRGFYGMRKTFRTLAFHVDEPEKFLEAVQKGIQKAE